MRTELSAAKYLFFWGTMLSMVVIGTEAFSYILLSGTEWKASVIAADLRSDSGEKNAEEKVGDSALFTPDGQVLHPYLGSVIPDSGAHAQLPNGWDWLANYGFGDDAGPLVRKRSPDKVVVGVFGGSVARQFVTHGDADIFLNELKKLPQFAGKEFIVTLPLNYGYKQPQAALTLQYLLTLGAKFDLIVLLDGFNDIAMPEPENYSLGVFPFYPRSWNLRMQDIDHAPAMRKAIARVAEYRDEYDAMTQYESKSLLGKLFTAKLLASIRQERLASKIAQAEEELHSIAANEQSGYIVRGPQRYYSSRTDLLKDAASVWEESSRQMHMTARANNIAFLHFLQPNQYDPGSKPMTAAEKKIALVENNPQSYGVINGYPLLREAGERLRQDGVHFYDMSMAFADTQEEFYVDNCCHINHAGNVYIARKMAEAVLSGFVP